MGVLPYKYRKIMEMFLKLMKLCEIMGSRHTVTKAYLDANASHPSWKCTMIRHTCKVATPQPHFLDTFQHGWGKTKPNERLGTARAKESVSGLCVDTPRNRGAEFVGSNPRNRGGDFMPFEEARAYMRPLNLSGHKEWVAWCRTGARPPGIPSAPYRTYASQGWRGLVHFLGNAGQASSDEAEDGGDGDDDVVGGVDGDDDESDLLEYQAARQDVAMRDRGSESDIYNESDGGVYNDSGSDGDGSEVDTSTALATEARAGEHSTQFWPIAKAQAYVRGLNMATAKEWEAWSKSGARPAGVPSNPQRTYQHTGWSTWRHWLGTDTATDTARDTTASKQSGPQSTQDYINHGPRHTHDGPGSQPLHIESDHAGAGDEYFGDGAYFGDANEEHVGLADGDGDGDRGDGDLYSDVYYSDNDAHSSSEVNIYIYIVIKINYSLTFSLHGSILMNLFDACASR